MVGKKHTSERWISSALYIRIRIRICIVIASSILSRMFVMNGAAAREYDRIHWVRS